MHLHLFFFLFITFSFHPCSSQKNNLYKSCAPIPFSCGNFTINITFPFSIDGTSPGCGLPDLHLSCTTNNLAQLMMNNVSYQVKNIDYEKHIMTIADMAYINIDDSCSYLSINTSFDFSLFDYTGNDHNLTYYGCSIPLNWSSSGFYELCNTGNYYYFIAVAVDVFDPLGYDYCDSRYNVSIGKPYSMDGLMKVLADGFDVMWKPGKDWCDKCVRSGGRCGFDESKPNDPLCLWPDGTYSSSGILHGRKSIIGISTGAAAIIITLVIAFLIVFKRRGYKIFSRETRKDGSDDVEKFIKDYRSMLPIKFSYMDVKRMTNDFRDKLGQGGYGSVYKGKLPNGQLIAAKILEKSKDNGQDFINEVATIGRIHHFNIIRLLGFCCEGLRRALIYEYMPNGSLGDLISNEEVRRSLGQEKLLEIAIDIANGIQYIHNGCDTRILHLDIKPQNNDYHPKISDFGLAKLYSRKDSLVSLSGARGTVGYIAQEIFMRSVGGVSHKSDVYSYGMLLLDMVVGRKNVKFENDRSSMLYFPNWIYIQLDRWKEMELDGSVVEDVVLHIVRKMVLVGLWCIQINPPDRPSISRVLEMLDGSHDNIEIPPKPFFSSSPRQRWELQISSADNIDAVLLTDESI